jgi:hypothetical protein
MRLKLRGTPRRTLVWARQTARSPSVKSYRLFHPCEHHPRVYLACSQCPATRSLMLIPCQWQGPLSPSSTGPLTPEVGLGEARATLARATGSLRSMRASLLDHHGQGRPAG